MHQFRKFTAELISGHEMQLFQLDEFICTGNAKLKVLFHINTYYISTRRSPSDRFVNLMYKLLHILPILRRLFS